LEGDPVVAVIAFMMKEDRELILSATEVFNFMEAQQWISEKIRKSDAWPKTVNSLKSRLTRVSTFLAAQGIEMNLNYRDRNSSRKYRFTNRNLIQGKAPSAVKLVTTEILNQLKSSQSELSESIEDPDGGYESIFDENGSVKD